MAEWSPPSASPTGHRICRWPTRRAACPAGSPMRRQTALALKDENALSSMLNTLTLPVFLLSGITLPLTLAPPILRTLGNFNPPGLCGQRCTRAFPWSYRQCSGGRRLSYDRDSGPAGPGLGHARLSESNGLNAPGCALSFYLHGRQHQCCRPCRSTHTTSYRQPGLRGRRSRPTSVRQGR